MHRAARIQKRMITVVSGQPTSSKWWWTGAMRKIRLPVSLKLPTWMITDIVSNTNSPPMIGSSSGVAVRAARQASPSRWRASPCRP